MLKQMDSKRDVFQKFRSTAAPVPILVKPAKKRAVEQFANEMLRVPQVTIDPVPNIPPLPQEKCLKESKKQSAEIELMPIQQCDEHMRIDSISSSPTPADLLSVGDSNSVNTESRRNSNVSLVVRKRLLSFAKDISRRTNQVKRQIQQPPTPDSVSIASLPEVKDDNDADRHSLDTLGFEDVVTPAKVVDKTTVENLSFTKQLWARWKGVEIFPSSFDFQSKKYLTWLAITSIAFLYNAYAVPLRASYPYQTKENLPFWMLADYFCDIIYLLDMTLFKPRLRFVRGGMHIRDKAEMRAVYLHSWTFKVDLLSLMPFDLLYLIDSVNYWSLVRLPRLVKIQCYWQLFYCIDSRLRNPYLLRVGKTVSYMLYLIHCNSCIYYSISIYEGVGRNPLVYSGKGFAYLRCFYFALKLAAGCGNNESPTNVYEHIYMTFSWFMGIFVFAVLLGQIGDIVRAATKNKETFRKAMDAALDHCKSLKVSKEVQDKVRLWFIHTWEEQKTLSEAKLVEKLPKKMQTDLAIACHYQTLSKVSLFQDCDKALLRDLVLKLKSVLFLPGDFVCRKGEVGKEMYIINKGIVEVVGGPNNKVLVTLREGSVFGEISLLSLSGGNRRTADVISKGFSNLFVLSKNDLQDAIKDYPVAQQVLKRKAKKLLKKNAPPPKEEDIKLSKEDLLEQTCSIHNCLPTPKLLETVLKVIDPTSETAKKLRRSDSESSSLSEDNSDCFRHWQLENEMDIDYNGDDPIAIEPDVICHPNKVDK